MMSNKDFSFVLQDYLKLQYSELIIEKFAQFLSLMAKWNRVYNLTAITEPKEMVIRHILDSLSIGAYLKGNRMIDVGTGAGLPGIPLALVNPEKQFVLLDSSKKKTAFLNQAMLELQINNVEIVTSRVENYHSTACFDTVISRAFSSIHDMLLSACHLCCEKGIFLAMKGVYPHEEIAKIPEGFVVRSTEVLKIPDLDAERHLVIVLKSISSG